MFKSGELELTLTVAVTTFDIGYIVYWYITVYRNSDEIQY